MPWCLSYVALTLIGLFLPIFSFMPFPPIKDNTLKEKKIYIHYLLHYLGLWADIQLFTKKIPIKSFAFLHWDTECSRCSHFPERLNKLWFMGSDKLSWFQ